MSTDIEIFMSTEFGQIRTVVVEEQPWFVGKDVATALGYGDTTQAIRKHVDTEDKLTRRFDWSGQNRLMTIINESGLYALIFSSKLESAKRFKRWVTSEVLPAIRRTGTYSLEKKVPDLPAPLPQGLQLSTEDERALAYNRGVVLGVLRHELEEDSALEIYERLSARGKGIVMKLLFGEVPYAQ